MRYGIPFQGSKNKFAKEIVNILPKAHTLIDLFAGGCAVTHAALLSGKWERIVANDIGPWPQVFLDAVHGRFRDEHRVITREEFHRLKDAAPYVALCWSFGNDKHTYLWGKGTMEDYKVLASRMIMADSVKERYAHYRAVIKYLEKHFFDIARPQELEWSERLIGLEGLQGLERLQGLQAKQHTRPTPTASP